MYLLTLWPLEVDNAEFVSWLLFINPVIQDKLLTLPEPWCALI